MKSNEVRVGNFILFSGVQTRVIPADFATQCRGINSSEMPNFNPIELTEEWLIKAGLEKTKDYYISTKTEMYKGFRFNLRVLANEYTFCYEGFFKKIEFVHQLQNLYFELTGSELNF